MTQSDGLPSVDAVALRHLLDGENALVDAFGIPDEVLAAPIGLPGGEASRTGIADLGGELPDIGFILERIGQEEAVS